jgi:hypothetical protein
MTWVTEDLLAELERSVSGAVIAPADAGYDGLRRCFNALVDRRPAVIVRCFGARDVATAFDFAHSAGLEVAVRGGGHNPAGHCVVDGGLVIDLSMMRRVDVKAGAKIALAEGGATCPGVLVATREERSSRSRVDPRTLGTRTRRPAARDRLPPRSHSCVDKQQSRGRRSVRCNHGRRLSSSGASARVARGPLLRFVQRTSAPPAR